MGDEWIMTWINNNSTTSVESSDAKQELLAVEEKLHVEQKFSVVNGGRETRWFILP